MSARPSVCLSIPGVLSVASAGYMPEDFATPPRTPRDSLSGCSSPSELSEDRLELSPLPTPKVAELAIAIPTNRTNSEEEQHEALLGKKISPVVSPDAVDGLLPEGFFTPPTTPEEVAPLNLSDAMAEWVKDEEALCKQEGPAPVKNESTDAVHPRKQCYSKRCCRIAASVSCVALTLISLILVTALARTR